MTRTRSTAALLFGSGLAALVYQTAWERMLRVVFGASTAASSAVLAIFLGGLGLGGHLLGKRAEKDDKPLLLYGNLELLIAASAAVTPFLVDIIGKIYLALGGSDSLGWAGATLVRLVLATVVLGPSVVLMGGTLPAAARAVESDEDPGRRRLAFLYACNTAGAVVGALLGTFLLFELFGTRLALWSAVILNVLVAVVARSLGRRLEPLGHKKPAALTEVKALAPPQIVYAAAFVVGFAFLGLELVWYRVLGPVLGGSSFTFGLVLAIALFGIGLGGFIYSRRGEKQRVSLGILAVTLALEAVCVGFPLVLGDGPALLAGYLRPSVSVGFGMLVLSWTVVVVLIVLPTALVSGYQFPVLFGLLGRGREGVARQVGLAYAFNTLGSIAGALLVGFIFLPGVGAITTWKVIVFTLACAAVALAALERRLNGPRAVGLVATAALVIVALWTPTQKGPTNVTRHTPIGAGRVNLASYDHNQLKHWMQGEKWRVIWEADGRESTVAAAKSNSVAFVVSGKSDGAVWADRGTQSLLGVLPALLHPDPKECFVLGLGTGMSAGWLGSVPSVQRLDVAELEPAIVGIAKLAAPANQNVLEQPKLNLFLGDGREYLLTHDRKYDVIASAPSNPYRAGIASLFTREFYQTVEKRLAPGGIFAQWVQGYEIDVPTLRVVLHTLHSVFPEVDAWQTQAGDFVMLATREPIVIDVDLLRRRVKEEPYRTILPRAGLVQDAEGILGRFLGGGEILRQIGGAFQPALNTDDSTVLEYAFGRRAGSSVREVTTDLLSLTLPRGFARPLTRGAVDWQRVEEERPRAWLVTGVKPPAPRVSDPERRARAEAVNAGCLGDFDAAARALAGHNIGPEDSIEAYVIGQVLAQMKDPRSLDLAKSLNDAGFVAEARVIRGRFIAGTGKRSEAMDEIIAALQELRQRPLPLCNTARESISLLPILAKGHPDLAAKAARVLLIGPLAVYAEEERRVITLQSLAFASGDTALCLDALGFQLEEPWWQEAFLEGRAQCLAAARHPLAARAAEDLAEFVSATPGQMGAGLTLPPPLPAPAPTPGPALGTPDPMDGDAGLGEPDAFVAPNGFD